MYIYICMYLYIVIDSTSYLEQDHIHIHTQSKMPRLICIRCASISIKFACTQVQKIIIAAFYKRQRLCKVLL